MTLVEVMIATSIFTGLALMGWFAQINLTKASNRSLALAELHSQAQVIMQRIRLDFGNMLPNTPLHVEVDSTDPAIRKCVFVHDIPRGAAAEDHNGSDWYPEFREHQMVWTVYDFNPSFGLRRAVSPADVDAGSWSASNADGEMFSETGERWLAMRFSPTIDFIPLIQREYRHYVNRGDPDDLTATEAAATVAMRLHLPERREYGDPYLPFRRPTYYLGNVDAVKPGTAIYGSRLPPPLDGWQPDTSLGAPSDAGGYDAGQAHYSRDRLRVEGVPHGATTPYDSADIAIIKQAERNPIYPSLVKTLATNVELFEVTFRARDGSAFGDSSIDVDGLHMDANFYQEDVSSSYLLPLGPAGGSASLADATMPNGAQISARRSDLDRLRKDALALRPTHVRVRFVLHDLRSDPTADGYQDPNARVDSIQAVRAEFYALAPADRSHDLLKRMIESRGATALVVNQSIRVP